MTVELEEKILKAIKSQFEEIREELSEVKETLRYIDACAKGEIKRLDKILEKCPLNG